MNRKTLILAMCLVLVFASILSIPVAATPTLATSRATPTPPIADRPRQCQLITCGAGTGLERGRSVLGIAPTYRLPQNCPEGNTIEWDGTSWVCSRSAETSPHDHWGESWSGDSDTGLSLIGPIGLYSDGDIRGVWGRSDDGYGVYGGSGTSDGVYGSSSEGNGVYGYSDDGYGVYGESGRGSPYAIYSQGDMHATGDITCDGTQSAVVETQDHDRRTLYAVESPGVWFEDFGHAQLDGSTPGQAVVVVEPVFAQTVNLSEEYHVFLTPLGDCGLYVAEKSSASFILRAVGGETCSVAFDYRIVARRLGYEDMRLEPIEAP